MVIIHPVRHIKIGTYHAPFIRVSERVYKDLGLGLGNMCHYAEVFEEGHGLAMFSPLSEMAEKASETLLLSQEEVSSLRDRNSIPQN